jgi:glc operon protein GlcG
MKTNRWPFVTAVALALLSTVAISQGQPDRAEAPKASKPMASKPMAKGQIRPMTVEFAKRLVAAAKKASCAPPAGACSGAFAIADDAGVIVYLEIIDGVLAGAPDLAIKKAKASALWRRPTAEFQDAVNNKTNTSYADGTFQDMTTSPGGVPLVKEGRIVGGFGAGGVGSNAANQQIDAAILEEAAKIFGPQ